MSRAQTAVPQPASELPLFLQNGESGQTEPRPTGGTWGDSTNGVLRRALTDGIEAERGAGTPLDGRTRDGMEAVFGTGFEDVRLHTDAAADALSRRVNATAFTTGSDIFFRQGAYSPHTAAGQQLLAHELTHVLQQRNNPEGEAKVVTPEGDPSEREAEAMGGAATPGTEQPGAANHLTVTGVGESNVVQRVTDQPELQEGIGWGLMVGNLLGNAAGVTTQWLVTCFSRLGSPQQAFMLAYRIVRILAASGDEQMRYLSELITGEIPPLSSADTVCDCVPAPLIALMARYGLQDYPDALAHLNHYLTGRGAPYIEDVERILDEDAGVRARIEEGIAAKRAPHGKLVNWVDQGDYSTNNWWYSLGGVDLFTYEILEDDFSKAMNSTLGGDVARVSVSIQDPYEWHPDEFRRIWCLHTGMEAMKAAGARDYWSMGSGIVALHVPPKLVPRP